MDLQLKGKRVLVTGSSRGIGLTIALAYAHEGAQPILVARDSANLALAEQAFAQAGLAKPSSVLMDLSVSGSAEQLFAQAPDVDILVNNAGAIPGGSVVDVDEQRWRQAWELKVFGYINMTRMYLPMMQARGHGVICNIIGMAGAAPRADYICGVHPGGGRRECEKWCARVWHQPLAHPQRPHARHVATTSRKEIGRRQAVD
jgi:NAD(P)-dependent dehydrogenase (short-subunit alcohol dehydrogenase family)